MLDSFAYFPVYLVLASQNACTELKDFKTQVNIELSIPETLYDYSVTQKRLTNFQKEGIEEWVQKNSMETSWKSDDMRVGGLTLSGISMQMNIEYEARKVDLQAVYACPYIKTLNISLNYDSMILIAKEYAENECTGNLVMEHELVHHQINETVVRKYAEKLKADIIPIIHELESYGPVERDALQDRAQLMSDGLKDAIKIYIQSIGEKATKANDIHDSPEEYERVSSLLDQCRKKK